jgi:hypothetical protein
VRQHLRQQKIVVCQKKFFIRYPDAVPAFVDVKARHWFIRTANCYMWRSMQTQC